MLATKNRPTYRKFYFLYDLHIYPYINTIIIQVESLFSTHQQLTCYSLCFMFCLLKLIFKFVIINFKFYWQCKHETHYVICIPCYFTFSNHTILKMTTLKKMHLNFNALSINTAEFDLKMLIQDEPNESGLCTPYSILKCTNSLGRPT
jgi:hypothetical protein